MIRDAGDNTPPRDCADGNDVDGRLCRSDRTIFRVRTKGFEVPGVIPGRKETTEKLPEVRDDPGSNQSKGGFAGMAVECVNQGL